MGDRVPNVPTKETDRPSASTVDKEVKPFPVKAFPFPPPSQAEGATGTHRVPHMLGPDK